MTRAEALALLALPQEQAVARLLGLAHKAEQWDRLQAGPTAGPETTSPADPLTPSGRLAPFHKPTRRGRRRTPGRKKGHRGCRRPTPETLDAFHPHRLDCCPHCQGPLGQPLRVHYRSIEDIAFAPATTRRHAIPGHWCGHCKKIVTPIVTDALPRAALGLNGLVYGAWLHYLLGVSVGNVARLLAVSAGLRVSPGGLTQAWARLAQYLTPYYHQIEQHVRCAATLHADETGWRLNGLTHWLWAFCSERFVYFLIDPHRSSAVVGRVLGECFDGFLICDFYAAYNRVEAWAKQRCLFHLFAELRRVDQRNDFYGWRAFRHKLSRLLHDAMRLKIQQPHLQAAVFERRKRRLHRRLDALILEPFADADAARLQKRLSNFRGELLTFLDHQAIVPTNNFAEQQIRKPVAARKICQQNRSTTGAHTHAVLLSLLRTAELQGHPPVEFLITLTKAAIAGRPLSIIAEPALPQAA